MSSETPSKGAKKDPSDQLKFLVTCIGHTTNGRPDFEAVAKELDIVSKAAAQKRYERMLKSHGITGPKVKKETADGSGDKAAETPTKAAPKRKAAGSAGPKKRTKAAPKKEEEGEDEDKPFKMEPPGDDSGSQSPLSDPPSPDAE